MMLGVEDPLEFPLPLAVVGKALAEGTIVGFSEDIVGILFVEYRIEGVCNICEGVDRVVYRYRATRTTIEFGKFGTWKMRNGNGNRKTESNRI